MSRTLTAAAVQIAPIWLEQEATVEKICEKIVELGRKGVQLMVFPEAIIPGTPHWIWTEPENSELFIRLFRNAVEVPGPVVDRLGQACREVQAIAVIGVHEREGKALYNTLLFFDRHGRLLGKHRKLHGTHSEKVLWAMGDGSGLRVYGTPFGLLGGLICGEHNMSLARHALAAQREEIHAATWIAGSARRGQRFNSWIEIMTRSYAMANQCFVVSAQACASEEEIRRFGLEGVGGWSAIIGPDGDFLAGPVGEGETDVVAEIDLESSIRTYPYFDTVGYNGRPDVFQFSIKGITENT